MPDYQQNSKVPQDVVEKQGAHKVLSLLLRYSEAPLDAEWACFYESQLDFSVLDLSPRPGYIIRACWSR